VASELFPSALKIKKQMAYANSRSIPWVIIAGEDEIRGEKITVKDMISGEQHIINKDEILDFLRKKK
jgi:histidyl-tRNA synthetase